jgi:hypothetical protein
VTVRYHLLQEQAHTVECERCCFTRF